MPESKWYDGGLCYECTMCGKCCLTGPPNHAPVTDPEVQAVADYLGVPFKECDQRYFWISPTGDDGALGRIPQVGEHGRCIFADARGQCSIHSVLLTQCRTFPFWKGRCGYVEKPEYWGRLLAVCPGAGAGALHTKDEIEQDIALVDRSSLWR